MNSHATAQHSLLSEDIDVNLMKVNVQLKRMMGSTQASRYRDF
jgi:hypothetical protein